MQVVHAILALDVGHLTEECGIKKSCYRLEPVRLHVLERHQSLQLLLDYQHVLQEFGLNVDGLLHLV